MIKISSSLLVWRRGERGNKAAAAALASRNLESTHSTSTSKSSKSSASCPPEPTPDVQCGNTYENITVILDQNLICTEGRDGSVAVVTLKGKKALLDCKGYTISQNTNSSAAAMDATEDLFYKYGVRLLDGASMVNCNIKKFEIGGRIDQGGVIKDSEFSLNDKGVQILNLDDAVNTVSKITNSEFYNNFDGLKAYQLIKDNSTVMIEDVVSENNIREGMYLTGTGITVNNANMSNIAENEITLAGDISITNSEEGILTRPYKTTQGTVYVTGNLISNRNELGLAIGPNAVNLTFAVGGSYSGKSGKSGSGSITACDNTLDIFNFGGSTFEGSDYTCDTTGWGVVFPACEPCHPGCPSPSSSASVELFSQVQHMIASSEADDDDDDDDDPILIPHLFW